MAHPSDRTLLLESVTGRSDPFKDEHGERSEGTLEPETGRWHPSRKLTVPPAAAWFGEIRYELGVIGVQVGRPPPPAGAGGGVGTGTPPMLRTALWPYSLQNPQPFEAWFCDQVDGSESVKV